jgi:hypothetical protein
MTQIVQSRFQYRGRHPAAPWFLNKLDVPYRGGGDFWKNNRHHLRALYDAMKDAARERMAELHPDRGGNGHEFAGFIADYRAAQKSFAFHLIGEPLPPTVKFTSKEQLLRNRKAAQARVRRRKNRPARNAARRADYAAKKANGTLPPNDPARSKRWRKRHPIKFKRCWKRYRAKNGEKVKGWKRAAYQRAKLKRVQLSLNSVKTVISSDAQGMT